jgi:cardiolipin synthase (CMP-forming)
VDTETTAQPPDPSGAAGPPSRSAWLTIPNLLSLGRLVLTPVVCWLILQERTSWATGLLAAMGVSDYLDGYIARRTNTVTDLGTTLDPVSDRVLAMAAGVSLLAAGFLPWWLGIPVLLRDAVLSVAFLLLARRGFGRPKVRRVGKTATFALFTAMPALLLGGSLRPFGVGVFAFGTVLYYIAGYRYYQDVQQFLAHQRRPFT